MFPIGNGEQVYRMFLCLHCVIKLAFCSTEIKNVLKRFSLLKIVVQVSVKTYVPRRTGASTHRGKSFQELRRFYSEKLMKFTLPISLLLKCGMGHCKILMLVKEHEYRYNVFSCTIFDNKKHSENSLKSTIFKNSYWVSRNFKYCMILKPRLN